MKEHILTIKIVDREYNLKANADNESVLKEASKLINLRVKEMQGKGVHDKQDLLAIVSFDLMVELLGRDEADKQAANKAEALSLAVAKALS
jgi:cell division protein ZapA (FtsZ GTPase activity inhibitor)